MATVELNEKEETIAIQSTVKDSKDVIWGDSERGKKNPLIKAAVLNDDMTLSLDFKGKILEVRSPDMRLLEDFEKYQKLRKRKKIKLSEANDLMAAQKALINDMVPGFDYEDRSFRLNQQDFTHLAEMCWEYCSFLNKKHTATP